MEAANPMGRSLLLAAALTALMGCRTDGGYKARGQMPHDPLAPVAPPPNPPPGTSGGFTPIAPLAPSAPAAPGAPVPGTAPAISGAAVPGSPVPPAQGPTVVTTG